MKTTPSINGSMGAVEWALLAMLSLLWGGSFFFVGVAVRELPPLTIVACRVLLAAIVLNGIITARGLRKPVGYPVWRAFFAMGLLNNLIPFSLIVWGQTHIGSGLASILNATTPLFTVIAAHFFTGDEKMTRGRLAGVATGLAGVVLMIGPEAVVGLGGEMAAQLAVLGAAISYSLAGIYGRRFGRLDIAPLVAATGQLTASALMLLPLALPVDKPWNLAMPSPGCLMAVSGLALLSTALAYTIYFFILARSGATNLMLVTFLIPVSAVLLGTMVLSERLDPKHLAGVGLIGLGLAAIDGRLPALLRNMVFSRSSRNRLLRIGRPR